MKSDNLYNASKDQLDLVLGFFTRADSKLSVVLALDTGMLAVLAADAPPLSALTWPTIVSAGLAILLLGASVVFLYRGAFPQLKGGQSSLVYFQEIASRTEHDFIEQFKQRSEGQHIDDVLGQVWRNSEVLKAKFLALRIAFILLALALIPWVVSLALFATYANPARSGLFH
jgi:hypothetical protein